MENYYGSPPEVAFFEELSFNSWPAAGNLLYDGWCLRFTGTYTDRSNSVWVGHSSTVPLPEKVELCERAYRNLGQSTIFRIAASPEYSELDRFLHNRRYAIATPTSVMKTDIRNSQPVASQNVLVTEEPSEQWYRAVRELVCESDFRMHFYKKIIDLTVLPSCFVMVLYEGGIAAIGHGVLERGCVGIYGMSTALECRRQGFAERTLAHILKWAEERDANTAYLHVLSDNIPAISLYRKMGYVERYRYWYRVKRSDLSD